MRQVRRWFGRLSILVGLVGAVSTVVGIVVVWRTTSALATQAVAIADMVIIFQDGAEQHVSQAENMLAEVQKKVSALQHSVEKVSGDYEQNREVAPTLQRIDDEIVRELGETRRLLQSIQSATGMLNQAVGTFDSLSSPMRMFRRSNEPRKNSDLSELSQSLEDASVQIQGVIDFVARMEQQGITNEQSRELKRSARRLEQHLKQGRMRLVSLGNFLQTTGKSVARTRDQVPFWANIAAAICTVLFVCFGFTQIQLIGFGRSILAATNQQTVR